MGARLSNLYQADGLNQAMTSENKTEGYMVLSTEDYHVVRDAVKIASQSQPCPLYRDALDAINRARLSQETGDED